MSIGRQLPRTFISQDVDQRRQVSSREGYYAVRRRSLGPERLSATRTHRLEVAWNDERDSDRQKEEAFLVLGVRLERGIMFHVREAGRSIHGPLHNADHGDVRMRRCGKVIVGHPGFTL
jgi:hypothetical protein